MSVTSVKNMLQVMIGKNVSATGASVQLTDPAGSNYIGDGEIVVLNSSNAYLTPGSTVADSEFIRLAYRAGNGNIYYSNRITGKNVRKYTGVDGVAGQEQIYHIGYNGSNTQTIDVTAGNDFYLHITNTFNDMIWSEQLDRRTYFSTFTVPTAEKVAADLVKQICIDPGSQVKAELLHSNASVTAFTGLTLTVVANSRVVSFSGAHGITSAGGYVRLGTTTVASAAAGNVPIYKVASVDSTTQITLEWPYQGPSQSNLSGTNDSGVVATTGSYWGIRLTGENIDSYRMDFFRFMRATFKVGMSGFGTTVLTKTQEMSLGKGDGRQVAEMESFAQGFDGPLNRMTVPLPLFRTDADKTTTTSQNATYANAFVAANTLYDCIAIIHGNTAPHFATAPVPSSEEIRLYIVDGAAQTANILAQLNPWMESAGLVAITT